MELFLFDDLFGINQLYVERFYNEKLHETVKSGDIELLEELLEEPAANINSVYYGENLLWTAIMSNQTETAVFLIDNGIDTDFKSCRIDIRGEGRSSKSITSRDLQQEPTKIRMRLVLPTQSSENDSDSSGDAPIADVYVISCRELAYEKEMFDLVKLIDYKQGNMLKGLSPPDHTPRLLKSAKRAEDHKLLLESPSTFNRKLRRAPHKQSPERKSTPLATKDRIQRMRSKTACRYRNATPTSQVEKRYVKSRNSGGWSSPSLFDSPDKTPHRMNIRNENIIPITKSCMARQKVSRSGERLDLKHSEGLILSEKNTNFPLGNDYAFERKLLKSANRLTEKKRSNTLLSYRNHLPPTCHNLIQVTNQKTATHGDSDSQLLHNYNSVTTIQNIRGLTR